MTKPAPVAPRAKPISAAAAAKRPASGESLGKTTRELIESVVIALVLAFLFRTFEAEAFVIPTGSMAPTLQGRHKDVKCTECGYWFRASASNEADEDVQHAQEELGRSGLPGDRRAQLEQIIRAHDVVAVTCPNCRHSMSVDPDSPEGKENPAYNGDRILVGKFPYEFSEPKRWDVVVFHYPGEAKVNYIKRLVGLPNETIRIYHGDLYKPGEDKDFEIIRKPPEKVISMSQVVYDNDYVVDAMTDAGWPVRWQPWPATAETAWTTGDGSRSYETTGESSNIEWVRYQHMAPTDIDWQALSRGRFVKGEAKPHLITDFYAYNTNHSRGMGHSSDSSIGLHWVSDLTLECELSITSAQGEALLDLVKGGKHFRATIDVATGKALLSIEGKEDYKPVGDTKIIGPGKYKVRFANVDRQLHLWVGGKLVTFDADTAYPDLGNDQPKSTPQDPGDLAPAGVGSRGAAMQVNHMKVLRDIYYIAAKDDRTISDYEYGAGVFSTIRRQPDSMKEDPIVRFFSSPQLWNSPEPRENLFDLRRQQFFELGPDQFFVLGDNSPASKDARLWDDEHYVDRNLLIGKALFIYWPASYNKVPGTDIPFPFFPNFSSMGFVR